MTTSTKQEAERRAEFEAWLTIDMHERIGQYPDFERDFRDNDDYEHAFVQENWRGWQAARAAQPAVVPSAVNSELRTATELAKAIWRDNYRATAPHWEPLETMHGVLSQIDNMVCGMSRATPSEPASAPASDTPSGAVCVCGKPNTTGIAHRKDGPCYYIDSIQPLGEASTQLKAAFVRQADAPIVWTGTLTHPPSQCAKCGEASVQGDEHVKG